MCTTGKMQSRHGEIMLCRKLDIISLKRLYVCAQFRYIFGLLGSGVILDDPQIIDVDHHFIYPGFSIFDQVSQ